MLPKESTQLRNLMQFCYETYALLDKSGDNKTVLSLTNPLLILQIKRQEHSGWKTKLQQYASQAENKSQEEVWLITLGARHEF